MAMVSLAMAATSASPRVCYGPLFGGAGPLRLRRSPPVGSSAVAFARRRSSVSTTLSKHKTRFQSEEAGEDEGDEDAFEALFKQLEEDLKNDDLSVDDADDEISEEDVAKLEQELAEALGEMAYDEESAGASLSDSEDSGNDGETHEIQRPRLKNWQLRRLARALKIGRRKTSIKNLAGELGLDRAIVLELLRNPPPNLLLMSACLSDEAPSKPESKQIEASPPTIDEADGTENERQEKLPIHVMRTRWSAQKRLKQVQVETLERVYSRTKRPTNTMISSIVHVTNLPRKTVVKWFEDKRQQEGVPDHRAPFKRSLLETISSS